LIVKSGDGNNDLEMRIERPNSTENFGGSINDSLVDCNSFNSQRHNSSPLESSHTTDFNSNESHNCDDYDEEFEDQRDHDTFDIEDKESGKMSSMSNCQKPSSSSSVKEVELHQQPLLTDYSIDQLLKTSKQREDKKETKVSKRNGSLINDDVNLINQRVPNANLNRPFQVSTLVFHMIALGAFKRKS